MLRNISQQLYKHTRLCVHLTMMETAKAKEIPLILHAPGVCVVRPPTVTVGGMSKTTDMNKMSNGEETISKIKGDDPIQQSESDKRLGNNAENTPVCGLTDSVDSFRPSTVSEILQSGTETCVDKNTCFTTFASEKSHADSLVDPSVSGMVLGLNNITSEDNTKKESSDFDKMKSMDKESVEIRRDSNAEKYSTGKLDYNVEGTDVCSRWNIGTVETESDGNSNKSSSPKQPVLNSELLAQVTSFVHENESRQQQSDMAKNSKLISKMPIDDKLDCSIARTPASSTECDTYEIDISPLFSELFEKSYQAYVKQPKKKSVKRKRQSEELSDCVNKQQNKRQRKIPPNYFLALQVTNPIIHKNVETVQKYMLEGQSELKKALISVPTLHLTLMVMNLASKEDIAKAVEVLNGCRSFIDKWMEEAVFLELSGIGHFKDEVVFVKIPDENQQKWLQELADHITTVFKENDIAPSDNKGFKPHITILKLSKAPQLRKKGVKKVTQRYYDPYKDSLFGVQAVENIQFCSMLKPKGPDGYYHVEHQLHCSSNFPLSTRDTPLLTLQKFAATHTPTSNIHTVTQESHTNTDTFERQIQWIFIEGENYSRSNNK